MTTRLSALDVSFLDVETPSAHMHVGWASLFAPPDGGATPSFGELRGHIAARLERAPRYRQRLAPPPLGLGEPLWVDDPGFMVERHVLRSDATSVDAMASEALSRPLRRDRPLWEVWIADSLADGRVGVVGKAHHCMVDGVATVELASLLLDPAPDPEPPVARGWAPRAAPEPAGAIASLAADRAREALRAALGPLRAARRPQDALRLAQIGGALAPAPPCDPLNGPSSPGRRLARVGRPLAVLREAKATLGVTLNDLVLAAVAGALRSFMLERGETPGRLKAMVPVNVRGDGDDLGNRISFLFAELPCDEPDRLRRVRAVHLATSEQKEAGAPEAGEAVLGALGLAPRPVKRFASRMVASPRAFNLVVSNIPGPPMPLWMAGCRLEEAYPVVPLSERHALAVGFTTIEGGGFFGLYVDDAALPDADRLAACLEEELDELTTSVAEAAPRA